MQRSMRRVRNKLRGWRFHFLVIVLATLAASAQLRAETPSQELIGRWRSLDTTKGGVGAMLVFHADGTLELSPGAIVEMQYRIEGEEVIFPPATTNGPERRIKLDFTGPDQLKIGSDQLTRKGPAPDSKTPVLGEWEGKRDMGGHTVDVRYLFYPSARCVLLVQFKTITCRYAIDGQNLRLEQPNQPPELRTFSLENGVLRVSDADQTHTYIRY